MINRTLVSVGCWLMIGCGCLSAQESSWDVIQHNIFGNDCAGCHQSGSGFAVQSDLVLTPDVAYGQLVNASPYNESARDDGLLRVSTEGGQPGLAQSFLWEKINAPNQDHFYDDHPGYGALMPIGSDPLTNGELSFIRSWILNGAPQTGAVADLALLDDTSRYDGVRFQRPEPPEQGVQLHLGPFDIWPAERNDREFYYFEPLVTEEAMFVERYEVSYREGSHHFILYQYEEGHTTPEAEVYRDIRDEDGRQIRGQFDGDHAAWVVATQTPKFDYQFPEGVAMRLPPGSGFDFNVHSVNRSGEPRSGEVYVNFHTAESQEVLHVATQDSFSNPAIFLPPGEVTTLEETFTFSETRNVVQLWTHAHEHMVQFRVEHAGGEQDGELIYWTNDWEHPRVSEYDDPLVFHRGDKVRLIATFDNDTDAPITFGPLSSDEMMFMFYISYPNTPDTNRDDQIDVKDIDALSRAVRRGTNSDRYDLNFDGSIDQRDRVRWVEDHVGTFFGDANLDREFNSSDLVQVFASGEYEDSVAANSSWGSGDWDGNGEFESSDLVLAFASGGYEKGPRAEVPAVPEPTASISCLLGFLGVLHVSMRRRRHCR